MRIPRIVALAAVLASPAWGDETPRIDLSPRCKAGDVDRYGFLTASRTTIDQPGEQQRTMLNSVEADIRLHVVSAGPEGATVELTYERLAATYDTPTIQINFDSAWPANLDGENEFAPPIRAIVGKTLTATLDGAGRMTDLRGVAEIAPPGMHGQTVRQLLSPESLGTLLSTVYAPKPDGEALVGLGEPWTITRSLFNDVGETRVVEQRTVRSIQGSTAAIGLSGTANLIKKKRGLIGSEFVEWKDGRIEGEAQWDASAHRTTQFAHTFVMQAIDRNPVRQGKDLTQTVVTTTRITRHP